VWFSDSKSGVEFKQGVAMVANLTDGVAAVDWENAE
jgi:hypothetical protein